MNLGSSFVLFRGNGLLAGALTSLFLSLGPGANAANIVFNGSAGSDWATSANWSPAQLPGSDDIAFLQAGVTSVVSSTLTVNPGFIRVGTSSAGATLTVASGGSLTTGNISLGRANNSDAKTGTLNLTGGNLSVTGYNSVAINVGLNDGSLGSSSGVVNLYSGHLSAAGTVYVGGTGANPAVGHFNIFGDDATFEVTSGFFWVTQNTGSFLNWDFYGGDNLTTITTTNNWRLFSGNTYTIDFANFAGVSGDYQIKLIESQGTGNADAASLFTFANTENFTNYSVAFANGNKDLVLSFTAVVPEPGTYALLSLALGVLVVGRYVRTRRAKTLGSR